MVTVTPQLILPLDDFWPSQRILNSVFNARGIEREMKAAGIYASVPQTDRFDTRPQAITEAATRLHEKLSIPQDFGSAV